MKTDNILLSGKKTLKIACDLLLLSHLHSFHRPLRITSLMKNTSRHFIYLPLYLAHFYPHSSLISHTGHRSTARQQHSHASSLAGTLHHVAHSLPFLHRPLCIIITIFTLIYSLFLLFSFSLSVVFPLHILFFLSLLTSFTKHLLILSILSSLSLLSSLFWMCLRYQTYSADPVFIHQRHSHFPPSCCCTTHLSSSHTQQHLRCVL
jgi:hypothetical protein